MWTLHPTELDQLSGAGGERFVHFMDRLIRGAAAVGGLPQAEIETQLRVNVKDGGVDTQVKRPIPNDSLGWFSAPTCWQFKAVEAVAVDDEIKKKALNDLQKEIRKPFSTALIKAGYAYRLCLLGDLTPVKLDNWESQLKAEVLLINPSAPPPRVVHGGHLPHWAERFVAVIAWLRNAQHGGLHLDAWRSNCRSVTPDYVPNPEWESARRQIAVHTDFSQPTVEKAACLTLSGGAGVGKTRLVFETLNQLPSASSLVVYTQDEQEAKRLATQLANTPTQHAILVADECSLASRHFLDEQLRGHSVRIRVLCIYNSAERPETKHPELLLTQEQLKNINAILERNFPEVPSERRHQYGQLSRGYVRLAADMCVNDARIASGDSSALYGSVEPYIRLRLQRDHLPIAWLIALFHKIGFREDAQSDLDVLCTISGISKLDVTRTVNAIRDSPGFIAQAGRFWYVTPEIVARILFADGWKHWVENDPGGFLKQLPEPLQQQLIDRAGKLGDEEVRRQTGTFFRTWFRQVTSVKLQDPHEMQLLESIVEAQPDEFLPHLRAVLENAEPSDLLAIGGYAQGAKWGPRRTIVWLLERLVSFADYFEDCEACLFLLSLNESEPNVGNNASALWLTLFNVYLSGTACAFVQRLATLERRLDSFDRQVATMAFRALGKVFQHPTGHVIGPPVVAGRLRPADWQPSSGREERECYELALAACAKRLSAAEEWRRELAAETIIARVAFLLYHGFVNEMIALAPKLEARQVRSLIKQVDDFIEGETETGRSTSGEQARNYIATVKVWIDGLRPRDFDGRLRSVCSRDPWDRRFSSEMAVDRDETDDLAGEILADQQLLEPHLDWLASDEAAAGHRLGFAIGRRDDRFIVGAVIFGHAIATGAARLLGGYIRGVAFVGRSLPTEVTPLLDRLDLAQPQLAVEIYMYGGDLLDGLNRSISLVQSGAVSPRHLFAFAMGVGRRHLTHDETATIVPLFVQPSTAEDAYFAGIRFLSTLFHRDAANGSTRFLEDSRIREAAWTLVEAATPWLERREIYEWLYLVKCLWDYDLVRAARVLGNSLLSDSVGMPDKVEEAFIELAAKDAEAVMESLGEALLDAENGWRLQVNVLSPLVARIPVEHVLKWLNTHGLEGARRIARHLPTPYVDQNGNAIVPEVTNAILTDFDDDRVFSNFVAGTHSGESWGGNASQRFRTEAENARMFLSHANHRIREWAEEEVAHRLRMADWEDQHHDEQDLPD